MNVNLLNNSQFCLLKLIFIIIKVYKLKCGVGSKYSTGSSKITG